MGAQPPWISKIYGFRVFFYAQRLLRPPPPEMKKVNPPLGQIPDYAPECTLSVGGEFAKLQNFPLAGLKRLSE